jgi:hypothetical protein
VNPKVQRAKVAVVAVVVAVVAAAVVLVAKALVADKPVLKAAQVAHATARLLHVAAVLRKAHGVIVKIVPKEVLMARHPTALTIAMIETTTVAMTVALVQQLLCTHKDMMTMIHNHHVILKTISNRAPMRTWGHKAV